MRVLDIRKRFKPIWLGLLVPFLIFLSGCGNGVSQEEFDAEQKRVQVQALQQRLDRGAAITDVLDTLNSGLGGGPSTESILRITPVVHAAGDPQLDAMWEEIGEAFSGGGDLLGELLREFVALVEASGNPQILEAFNPTFPIWLNIPLSKSSAFLKPLSICETLAVGMAIITP